MRTPIRLRQCVAVSCIETTISRRLIGQHHLNTFGSMAVDSKSISINHSPHTRFTLITCKYRVTIQLCTMLISSAFCRSHCIIGHIAIERATEMEVDRGVVRILRTATYGSQQVESLLKHACSHKGISPMENGIDNMRTVI